MANLTRWGPVSEMMTLRNAMDRWLDDALVHPFSWSDDTSLPAVDMYQTEDDIIVKASLPGYKAQDVNITVNRDNLLLRGDVEHTNSQKDATYIMHEQRHDSFKRSIKLPSDVKADKVNANFEDGILTIKMPIAEEVKPKSVAINVKSN
jgi:HSP20 family protein